MTDKWLTTVLASLVVAAIAGMVVLYGDIRVMQSEVNTLLFDETTDAEQDRKIRRQWSRQAFILSRINELRTKHEMPLAEWPDNEGD